MPLTIAPKEEFIVTLSNRLLDINIKLLIASTRELDMLRPLFEEWQTSLDLYRPPDLRQG